MDEHQRLESIKENVLALVEHFLPIKCKGCFPPENISIVRKGESFKMNLHNKDLPLEKDIQHETQNACIGVCGSLQGAGAMVDRINLGDGRGPDTAQMGSVYLRFKSLKDMETIVKIALQKSKRVPLKPSKIIKKPKPFKGREP